MKTKVLKLILPAVAFLLALGTAFATHSMANTVDVPGYIQTGNPVQPCQVDKLCSTVGTITCTSSSGQVLYQLQGIECTNPLFERP